MSSTHVSLSSATLPEAKPSVFKTWLEQTGLHGKLLAGGAVLGVISAFLPLVSIKFGGFQVSAMVIDFWQGMVGLLAYIFCGVCSWMLYQPTKNGLHANLLKGLLGAAGLTALFAVWLLLGARHAMGFGAITNLVAAGVVTAGAVLKAKAEKVF